MKIPWYFPSARISLLLPITTQWIAHTFTAFCAFEVTISFEMNGSKAEYAMKCQALYKWTKPIIECRGSISEAGWRVKTGNFVRKE
jgi:hypothetical protein